MSSKKDVIAERLQQLNKNKQDFKQDKPNVMESIATGKDEKIDFMAMVKKIEGLKKDETKGLNDGYRKDTIYIREDLYNALNALCVKQGDKKQLVNEMYEEFLTKKYKALQKDINFIDN